MRYKDHQVAVREGSSYSIRRAQLEDLIPIMEVNLKTLPEHYSDFFYEGLLSDFPETFMVAELDSRDVGYVMCKCDAYTGLQSASSSNFKKCSSYDDC